MTTTPKQPGGVTRVYVASSWRNAFQPEVVKALRADGHEVYDFKDSDGFHWSEVDPAWQEWPSEIPKYLAGLRHPCAERGFNRDMTALRDCDVCVYVMPCGPSASMEMGWACGAGKRVAVYIPAIKEPDLMVKMAHLVTDSLDAVRKFCSDALLASRAEASPASTERASADPERISQLIAHRACCGTEHDPAKGKLHGYCVVCGVPWPCDYAGKPLSASLAPYIEQEVERARDALRDILKLIDDGQLVRDISHDHEEGWAMKQISLVMTLKRAQEVEGTLTARLNEGRKT